MFKLITYGAIFFFGYKIGTMTPEERRKLLSGTKKTAKVGYDRVRDLVVDETGKLTEE